MIGQRALGSDTLSFLSDIYFLFKILFSYGKIILKNSEWTVMCEIVSAFEWWFHFYVAYLQQLQTMYVYMRFVRNSRIPNLGQGVRTYDMLSYILYKFELKG